MNKSEFMIVISSALLWRRDTKHVKSARNSVQTICTYAFLTLLPKLPFASINFYHCAAFLPGLVAESFSRAMNKGLRQINVKWFNSH